MSYLSCLLWLLSCWQLHAMIIRKESTRAVHLVIALAFDGMTCSSPSFLCPRSWILSCSLFFSQSHVGPVGLLRWSLYLSHHPAAPMSCSWGALIDRRGSLLSALTLGLNPGRIIGRHKTHHGQSAIRKSWRNLSWTLRRIKSLHPIWWSHCSFLKIPLRPCNQCNSHIWRRTLVRSERWVGHTTCDTTWPHIFSCWSVCPSIQDQLDLWIQNLINLVIFIKLAEKDDDELDVQEAEQPRQVSSISV